jgi:hypothetical protein
MAARLDFGNHRQIGVPAYREAPFELTHTPGNTRFILYSE